MDEHEAALTIQTTWKRHKYRKELKLVTKRLTFTHQRLQTLEKYHREISIIHASKITLYETQRPARAATKIQRWWRRIRYDFNGDLNNANVDKILRGTFRKTPRYNVNEQNSDANQTVNTMQKKSARLSVKKPPLNEFDLPSVIDYEAMGRRIQQNLVPEPFANTRKLDSLLEKFYENPTWRPHKFKMLDDYRKVHSWIDAWDLAGVAPLDSGINEKEFTANDRMDHLSMLQWAALPWWKRIPEDAGEFDEWLKKGTFD